MKVIHTHFPDLNDLQQQQLKQLHGLYADWNQKINVISRKDLDAFDERHVLHSLALVKAMKFAPGSDVLDVGTGGGFPGIPLAISMYFFTSLYAEAETSGPTLTQSRLSKIARAQQFLDPD